MSKRLFEHRHAEGRANTSDFDGSDNHWIPVGIRLRRCEVGYLNRLLCRNNLAGATIWRGSERFFAPRLGKCRRHIMCRTNAKSTLVI
jgi:hypothetical protein